MSTGWRFFPTILILLLPVGCGLTRPPVINELPMYGGLEKPEELKKADQQFIDFATKSAGGREEAAEQTLARAWQHIRRGELSDAMKRLNQAWLLNPDRAEIYWGYGVILSMTGDFDSAISHLEKARSLDPENPRLEQDIRETHRLKSKKR